MGRRPVRLFLGPVLRAVHRRRAARRQAGGADVRPRHGAPHGSRRPFVGQRGERPRKQPRRGSRARLRRRAHPRRSVVAGSPGTHLRRRRHARRTHRVPHGAIPRLPDAQPDERCQRAIPPARRNDRPGPRRARLLLHLLAVGHLPRMASVADAHRHHARKRHDLQYARHVRRHGRTAHLASRLGRNGHDDRLSRRVGHRRRLPEGHPRLRRRTCARGHDPLVEPQQEGFRLLRGHGIHPLEHQARIGLLHPRIRLRRLDDRPHGRSAGPRRNGRSVLPPGAQLRERVRRFDTLLPGTAVRRRLDDAFRGVRHGTRLHRSYTTASSHRTT